MAKSPQKKTDANRHTHESTQTTTNKQLTTTQLKCNPAVAGGLATADCVNEI